MRLPTWIVLATAIAAIAACSDDKDDDTATFDAASGPADAAPRPDAEAVRNDAALPCPADFVPGALAGQVVGQGGARAGLHIDIGAGNLISVAYADTTPVDTDFALSAALELPNAGAAYHVNIASQRAERAFIASAGTLRFTTACTAGATGTLTDVTLIEVDQTTGMPVAGGCVQVLPPATTFAFGTACPTVAP